MPADITPSDPLVKKAFSDFKEQVMKEATAILMDKMPQKILYFNSLVGEKNQPWNKFNAGDLSTLLPLLKARQQAAATADNPPNGVGEPVTPPAKRQRLESKTKGTQNTEAGEGAVADLPDIPPNPQILEMTEELKREVAELMEMAGSVKLFIQLNVPRIEGGNNFGVQIQEEAIQELARVEESAYTVSTSIVEYFSHRARLICKIVKHPHIRDFQEALRELDEKKWMLLKVSRLDMRNNYAGLYDLLSKNWEKVVKPRHEGDTPMIY